MKRISKTMKTILIFIIIILTLTFSVGMLIKNVVNYQDTVDVLVFKENLDKGTKISDVDKYFKTIKISKSEIPPASFRSINDLNDMYIGIDVYKGEFVTDNKLSKVYPYKIKYDIPDDKSLVSLKFDNADSANAWNVFTNQKIKIVFTPSNSVNGKDDTSISKRIINAEIYSIKDSQFFVEGEIEFDSTKLNYITFLVKKSDAIIISNLKDKGRFDIIQ